MLFKKKKKACIYEILFHCISSLSTNLALKTYLKK